MRLQEAITTSPIHSATLENQAVVDWFEDPTQLRGQAKPQPFALLTFFPGSGRTGFLKADDVPSLLRIQATGFGAMIHSSQWRPLGMTKKEGTYVQA